MFRRQYNARDLETDWTTPREHFKFSIESKVTAIVADVSDPVTSYYSRFSCLLFVVCVDYGMSSCVNPNFLA